MRSGRNRVVRLAGLLLLWPVAFAALYFYRPVVLDGPVLCPVRLGTGLQCPGCGLTRAFSFMTRGEFDPAIRYNALAPIVAAYLAVVWIYYAIAAWRGSPPAWPTWTLAGAMMVIAGAFWMGRLVEVFSSSEGLSTIWRDNALARLLRALS
jgi:hypothetical protein